MDSRCIGLNRGDADTIVTMFNVLFSALRVSAVDMMLYEFNFHLYTK